MPFALQSGTVEMRECPASPALESLRREAETNPLLALACSALVREADRRDALLKAAFPLAMRQSPALARRFVESVAMRPWIGDLSLPLAMELGDRRVLEACVRAHPSIALREPEAMARLGLLSLAITLSPGEALGIAAGSSARAARLREHLPPPLQALLGRDDLNLPLRQRLAWLVSSMPLEEALRTAADDRLYFARIAAADLEARPFAERFFLEARQRGVKDRLASLRRWEARELYLLLVQGREQVDKPLFQTFFDSLLRNKLERISEWPYLRRFVRDAAAYGRMEQLPPDAVQRAVESPESYEDMLLAAEIAGILELPWARGDASPQAHEAWMLQRYYFYDDEDGRASFASFRRAYQTGGWTWKENGGSVTVTKGPMRIVANKPGHDFAWKETPGVVVHRGHEFHVPKTLERLPRSTRFVFLGSCRGMGSVAELLRRAPRADVLVTRATGTLAINDPLLKELNETALRGPVDWEAFWNRQKTRFRGNPHFSEYVPPHHNAAAFVIKAYERYLSNEDAPPLDAVFARWGRELASRCHSQPAPCSALGPARTSPDRRAQRSR